LPDSDIDVLCFAPDAHVFTDTVGHNFSNATAFEAKRLVRVPQAVVVCFEVVGWRIELYGEAIPVEQQRGWRHFAIEQRLLALGGDDLPVAVLPLRQQGMKTELAFATTLRLRGDPYLALLDLGEHDDERCCRPKVSLEQPPHDRGRGSRRSKEQRVFIATNERHDFVGSGYLHAAS
jgi:hypothetical protein